jgi:hypothetical protein
MIILTQASETEEAASARYRHFDSRKSGRLGKRRRGEGLHDEVQVW